MVFNFKGIPQNYDGAAKQYNTRNFLSKKNSRGVAFEQFLSI
jgi:hypothetical protein